LLDKRKNKLSKICYLELGCGNRKRHLDSIGIDLIDYEGVDIVGDIFEALSLFEDGSVDGIYSYHFFAHVGELPQLIKEIERVLKAGAFLHMTVPHFSNPFYYSDPTHKTFFGLYTMSYFSADLIHKRQVPNYNLRHCLQLNIVELVFKSYPPHYVRHAFKKFFGFFVNLTTYTKEFYEENLSTFISCYEIKFYLSKSKSEV